MNHSSAFLRATPAGALLLALLAAPLPVQAQRMSTPSGPVVPAQEFPTKAPPPRALPGSRTDAAVAPMDRPPSDMKPNEALFDAINRGDVVAARDAIGRGADPDSRNILDLTPIDLAVDLGRNDITFLLLALRGGGSSSAVATAAPRNTGPAPVSARSVEARPTAATRGPASAANASSGPQQVTRNSDPGTPAPQAGFLGFGGATLR
jgi:hypothetical protein